MKCCSCKFILRILVAAVAALVLMLSVAGCTGPVAARNSGEGAVRRFMGYIEDGDYGMAWEMLSASVKNTSDSPSDSRITKQEFIDKYNNIFTALKISSVEYSDYSGSGGDVIYACTFNGTYYSQYIGDNTYSFRANARREGGNWCVEWSPTLIFPEMQWGDTVRITRLAAQRGDIVADGTVLATNTGYISVYALSDKFENSELVMSQLVRLLDSDMETINKALEKVYNGVAVLKQFHEDEFSDTVKEQLMSIEGIGIDYGNYGTYRDYPYGETMSHFIGYVGPITAPTMEELDAKIEELNEGRTEKDGLYTYDSLVGILGVEKEYEKELRGHDGEMVYICTSDGTNRSTIFKRPAEDGYDVMLTVDMSLQQKLDNIMSLSMTEETIAGAVVVMNPTTGEIQAMGSYPGYDLNLFARRISSTDYGAILNDPAKPLINRLTNGLYPPGSTMKAFTAAAALESGVMTEEYAFDESKINDDYWIPEEYGAWIWSPIKRTHIKYPESGPLNMRKAMIHSDNIYFANAALMTGWETFSEYLYNAGFSQTMPFDIAVSAPQLINSKSEVTMKLIADSGYGQGEVLVTPIQWAAMFSVFANEGDAETPYFIKGLYRENGILFEEVRKNITSRWLTDTVSDEAIATITPMLMDVVNPDVNGTGRKLKVEGCVAAGKTGTAEIGNDKSREISWIAAYRVNVPDEDARLVLVMLEIPAKEEYTSIKLDVARVLLTME